MRDDSEANWNRQADRQTGGQADRQTDRQTDGQDHILSQADALTKLITKKEPFIEGSTELFWLLLFISALSELIFWIL